MQKTNIGLDYTLTHSDLVFNNISLTTHRSRDTAPAQPPNWCDPLVYSQNVDIYSAHISKTTKTNKHTILRP